MGAVFLALCAACAGSKDNVDITKPVTGAEASNAEKAYNRGLQERKDKNFLEAVRYLEYVRNNFPYSQYAGLAELAIADMSFERDDFGTAAAQYQDFVKSHPSHPKADYAAFRAGLARWEDKPSDFWLFPPADEKDQAPLRSALDSLQRFMLSYPKSEYVPRARQLVADVRERLAKHEQYVADFYWKRKVWKGAATRLVGLADNYGDLRNGTVRSDSLWRAGEAYRNLNDASNERKVLQRLVLESPGGDHAREAQARLQQLPSEEGAPPPQQKAVRPSPTPAEPQPAKPTEPSK
ncbi:MAG TPA: outer membrane protein assembly factor BamD [Myxococcales bacterium]|nr:outer membrane protein assembly factor BamD [Myxococcales bacterium]